MSLKEEPSSSSAFAGKGNNRPALALLKPTIMCEEILVFLKPDEVKTIMDGVPEIDKLFSISQAFCESHGFKLKKEEEEPKTKKLKTNDDDERELLQADLDILSQIPRAYHGYWNHYATTTLKTHYKDDPSAFWGYKPANRDDIRQQFVLWCRNDNNVHNNTDGTKKMHHIPPNPTRCPECLLAMAQETCFHCDRAFSWDNMERCGICCAVDKNGKRDGNSKILMYTQLIQRPKEDVVWCWDCYCKREHDSCKACGISLCDQCYDDGADFFHCRHCEQRYCGLNCEEHHCEACQEHENEEFVENSGPFCQQCLENMHVCAEPYI